MAHRRVRKPPMSQINVVPYIDVMLVLLVIFMVTAPLLTQGVQVDLPQAAAEALPAEEIPPLVVTIDAEGAYHMHIGTGETERVDAKTLLARTAAVLRNQPKTPVVVRGARQVSYEAVVNAMVLLQQAGAPSVGLMTDPPTNP